MYGSSSNILDPPSIPVSVKNSVESLLNQTLSQAD